MLSLELFTGLTEIRDLLAKRSDKNYLKNKNTTPEDIEANAQKKLEALKQSIQGITEPLAKDAEAEGAGALESAGESSELDLIYKVFLSPAKPQPKKGKENPVLPREQPLPEMPKAVKANLPYYPSVYAALLPWAKLMYQLEQNGIAEEHAYKLATIFDTPDKALNYLSDYFKANKNTEQLMHDANLYALPQGDVDWETWRALTARHLSDPEYRKLILPQASEIQASIVASAKTAKQKGKSPTLKDIEAATKEISQANVEWKKLKRKRGELSEDGEKKYQRLTKELSTKKMALAELGPTFDNQLALPVLKACREKCILESSEAYKLFSNNGLSKKDYVKFLELERQDDDTQIPNITLDGAEFGQPGYYLMKVPVMEEIWAAKAAYLGKLTDCCQSLSGEAGEPCTIHGLTSPYGGFYVLCKGDTKNPQVSDELLGQCWAWRSKNNALVFDSIEISPKKSDDATKKMVAQAYERLAKEFVGKGLATKVACGSRSGISSIVGIESSLNLAEDFRDYQGYRDSSSQRVIFDKANPFYGHGIDKACTDETEEKIKEVLSNKQVALGSSEFFRRLINWAILDNKEDLLTKTREIAKKVKRDTDVERFIDISRKYIENTLTPDETIGHIERDELYMETKNKDGDTPLIAAAKKGHREVAIKLIDMGADIEAKDNLGDTPLIAAAEKGHREVALKLIDMGADIEAKDNYGNTPLILTGHREVALKLIDMGADIEAKGNLGTPLIAAAMAGRSEVALKLIDMGADIEAKGEDGKTALILGSLGRAK